MTRYLVDNSAWARLGSSAIPTERRLGLVEAAEDRRVWVSSMLCLEAGYSARNADAYLTQRADLARYPEAVTASVDHDRALDLQTQLALVGHHRVPPADLLTVAVAERHGLTVLHYDKDYDVIRERTDCLAETEWLVPRGSL